MKREIIHTADGSPSVYCHATGETFHSKHGALQESMHVFIQHGLDEVLRSVAVPKILEIGFGSGLNALLTLARMEENQRFCHYVAVEQYPLEMHIAHSLDFIPALRHQFLEMHQPQSTINLTNRMQLHKVVADFRDPLPFMEGGFNLVYFDAFSPTKQPELWTATMFERIAAVCAPNAILVTYSSKGEVRRNMQSAGWLIEKLPGPKGKREMVRGRNRIQ